MSNNIIKLDSKKSSRLIDIFDLLKDDCNDICIKNGHVRQRNNSSATIYEIDITDILNNTTDIILHNVAEKFNLINSLIKGCDESTIEIKEKSYIFSDGVSNIEFIKANEDYIKVNSYVQESYFRETLKLEEKNLILETEFDKTRIKKIVSICKTMNTNQISTKFADRITFEAKSQISNKPDASFKIKDIDNTLNLNGECTIPDTPFKAQLDNMNLKLYQTTIKDNEYIIFKFTENKEKNEFKNISIFCPAKLINK